MDGKASMTQKQAGQTQAGKKQEKTSGKRKRRILLIEDDSDMLFLTRDMLESGGYEVDLADSGAEGILRFRRSPPDLVLLDVVMPGMDGYDVCRKLRQQDPSSRWHRGWKPNFRRPPHIPIVFLTAHATLDHVQEAAQVGVDGYIIKTHKKQELLERVSQFVKPERENETKKREDIETYFKNVKFPARSTDTPPPVSTPPAQPIPTPGPAKAAVSSTAAPSPIPRRGSGLVESKAPESPEEMDVTAETVETADPFSKKEEELRGWLIQMFNAPESADREIVDVDVEYERVMSSAGTSGEPITNKIREMTHRFGERVTGLLGLASIPGECRIRILDDGLKIELDIDPPAGPGPAVTVEKVRRLLREHKVVYGIDEEAIAKAVETGKSQKVYGACIASGIPSDPGEDGKIEMARNGALSHFVF